MSVKKTRKIEFERERKTIRIDEILLNLKLWIKTINLLILSYFVLFRFRSIFDEQTQKSNCKTRSV